MSNITTDDFETIKQLLASAASFAESSHERLNQVSIQQQQATQETRELRESIRELRDAQKRTDERLESFIFEAQRIFTQQAATIEQLKGMSERWDGVLAYLIRKEQRGE